MRIQARIMRDARPAIHSSCSAKAAHVIVAGYPPSLYSAIISTELSLDVYAGGGGIAVGSELMVMAEQRLTLPLPRPAPFLSGASQLLGVRGGRRLGLGVGEVRVRVRISHRDSPEASW